MNRGRNFPPADVVVTKPGSGLALWRHRQAEDKKERMAELEKLRENAETVLRDGKEYRLLRIPDFYDKAWKRDAA